LQQHFYVCSSCGLRERPAGQPFRGGGPWCGGGGCEAATRQRAHKRQRDLARLARRAAEDPAAAAEQRARKRAKEEARLARRAAEAGLPQSPS
jgi:hypothetical protein